jgi:hypothetical protein
MPDEEPLERLVKELRLLCDKVEKLQRTYGDGKVNMRKFDLHRSLDKAEAEVETAGYWVSKAQATLDSVNEKA